MREQLQLIADLLTLAEDTLVLADEYSGGDSEELTALRSRLAILDSRVEKLPATLLL